MLSDNPCLTEKSFPKKSRCSVAFVMLAVKHLLQLVHEGLDILEFPVDRCEADVSDRIDILDLVHYKLADIGARNFLLFPGKKLRLNFIDQTADLLGRYRTLVAGTQDSGLNLLAVILLPVVVLLDDDQRNRLNLLIRSEPLPALIALAAPPDRGIIVGRTRINYTCVVTSAKRTFHEALPSDHPLNLVDEPAGHI